MKKITKAVVGGGYKGVRLGKTMTIRLPEKVDKILREIAKQTDTSTSYHIRRALEVYFDESYADAEIAMLRDEQGSEDAVSFKQAKQMLNMDEDVLLPLRLEASKAEWLKHLSEKINSVANELNEIRQGLPNTEDETRNNPTSFR